MFFRAAVKGHIKLEDGLNIRDLLDLKDAFLVSFIGCAYYLTQSLHLQPAFVKTVIAGKSRYSAAIFQSNHICRT